MKKFNVGVITSIHPRSDARINIKTTNSLSNNFNASLIVFDGLGDDVTGKFPIYDAKKFGKISLQTNFFKSYFSFILSFFHQIILMIKLLKSKFSYEIIDLFISFVIKPIRLTINYFLFIKHYCHKFFKNLIRGRIDAFFLGILLSPLIITLRIIMFSSTIPRSYYINKVARTLNLDVVHLHDPELIFLGLYLKLKGMHVIYDSHEDFPKQILGKNYLFNSQLNNYFVKILAPSARLFFYIILRHFSGVIAATPSIRNSLIKINPNCIVINNYPVLSDIEFTSFDKKKKSALYIGNVHEAKGSFDYENASKFVHRSIVFDIVGRYRMPLYFSNNLKYHGLKSRNELNYFFRNSFVGLCVFHPIPNYIEAQPIKLYEYMAAGRPVIVSNFPLWEKFIRENNCGIVVPPHNPRAIAEAVEKLYYDQKLASRLGVNGRRAVEAKYNWSLEEVKLIAFYNKILN
ncbi:glycosyltransferase [Methylophilaceae bacterium]|nr:glycosyltransferase [Methylophilaceae bacterium]